MSHHHHHHHHHGHHHGNQGFQQNQGYNMPNQGFGNMNDRDQQLRNAIDQIFYKYDRDNSGFLEEKEFQACIGQLCRMLNKPQPNNYNEFIQIAKSIDANYDGKISKIELFNLFKRVYAY